MTSSKSSDSKPSDSMTQNKFILGGGKLGLEIAQLLQQNGHKVTIVNKKYKFTDIPGIKGDPINIDVLTKAGLEKASSVIIATKSDSKNFLIAQLIDIHFNTPQITVLVNNPKRLPPISDAGHKTLCLATALYESFTEYL